jgi:hypothetical protein
MIGGGAVVAACFALAAACASTASVPDDQRVPAAATFAVGDATRIDPDARFWYDPKIPLGHPSADSLRNANGSPRITDPSLYDAFWRELSGPLGQWSADQRIRLNPNFIAALMAKESGFDPRATSEVPAYGIAQMTHVADADLQLITRDAPGWHWMYDEVRRWPRVAAVHDSLARKSQIDSLLASGVVNGKVEYLFDPRLSLRASLFWLRLLGHVWTEDVWPGAYGTLARTKLANGRALSESDLLALVTVSYNQGYPYAADLVERYGRDWTSHLNPESADYLERIAAYTAIFQRAKAR